MVPDNILRRIDDLQLSYIDALDSKDLAGWLGAFQENAAEYYVIPVEHIEQTCRCRCCTTTATRACWTA